MINLQAHSFLKEFEIGINKILKENSGSNKYFFTVHAIQDFIDTHVFKWPGDKKNFEETLNAIIEAVYEGDEWIQKHHKANALAVITPSEVFYIGTPSAELLELKFSN